MPTPSSAPTGPRLSRRAALGGVAAVAGAALTGCTVENPFASSRPGPTGPSPADPAEAPADPDVTTAGEALRVEQETAALLRATARRHPRLAAPLAAPLAAHEAHVALLDEAAPGSSPSPAASPAPSGAPSAEPSSPGTTGGRRTPVARSRARALRDVVDTETALSATLQAHALAARSGAFARLLGSMSASAAQHAAVLGREVRG